MRLPALLAAILLIGTLPAAAQDDAPPDEEAGLVEEAPAASDAPPPPTSPSDEDEADDAPPTNPTYDRAPGERYERHGYGDDDDYATGRRRTRRAVDDDDDDEREEAGEEGPHADDDAQGEKAEEDGGRRRRRGEDAASSEAPAAAPNPWVGPAVVGLCALVGGCGCLAPAVCLGTSPSAGPLAAILAAPSLVIGAVAGAGSGGLLHLLFVDGVSVLPCVVAPVAAFILAAVFGGLGAVTGLLVGTNTGSAPAGVIAALSVLIPGVLAVAAGASATYSGVAFLMGPEEAPAGGDAAADAPPAAAEPEASSVTSPLRRLTVGAMVY